MYPNIHGGPPPQQQPPFQQQGFYAEPSQSVLLASLEQFQGTVFPAPNFNPEADCRALSQAMQGAGKSSVDHRLPFIHFLSSGTNERALVDIVANRSNVQRQQIKFQYKTLFGVV